MGYDFRAETLPEDHAGFGLVCECGRASTGRAADTYADALHLLTQGNAPVCDGDMCGQHSTHGGYVETLLIETGPSLHVSGATAHRLLRALGYDIDTDHLGGEANAAVFLDRTSAERTPADPYLAALFQQLRELAEWAYARDRLIVWC